MRMKLMNPWGWIIFTLAGLLVMFTGCVPSDGGCGSSGGGTGGATADIEAEYAVTGPHATTSTTVTGYRIFHPRQMSGGHPIITWGNGTGAPTLTYTALLNHLASWGFVVIASDSTMTQSGAEMIGGIDYLIEQNATPGSAFYGKLDASKIGSTGHSQGGGGAINTASDPRVKCSVPIAPSPGQIGQVKGPTFLVAGASDTIVSASLVRSTSYALAKAPTLFGIAAGMGHMNFAGDAGMARGYITAWFMSYLQADPVAAKAFTGSCEICTNPNWQVEKKNF
jgi:dienelactone hydrolase